VADAVEFVDEPDPGPGELEDVRRPRRRGPILLVLAVAAAVAGWAMVRPDADSPRPASSSPRPAATAARSSAAEVAVRPRSGPPGCPPGVFCDVSRDQVPQLLLAVQRHFPGARTLTTYTVLSTGSELRGGGLVYRQDALTVGDGLLVITVRARPVPPRRSAPSVTRFGRAADLRISLRQFDLDLQFTGVAGPPVSARQLAALAEEPALTALS
jgi:hypothetical protein